MKEKLQAFWAKLNTDVGSLWQESKFFVIIFGILILVVKFRSVLISLLVADSKHIFDDATKKSDELKKQENDANSSADKLVEEAKKLADSNKPVEDDWYKK